MVVKMFGVNSKGDQYRRGLFLLVYGVLAWLVFRLVKVIIDRLIRSPLRTTPGPLPAKLTSQWLQFIDFAGNRTSTIHKLHQQYGPIVQIGPNEISFASIDAIRDIYSGQNPFMKSAAYDNFGRKGAFQMRDKEDHRQRRKRINHVFSQSVLLEMEPLIRDEVENLLKVVDERCGEPYDVLHWFRMLALDVVGQLFLGKSFGALKDDRPPPYVHHLDNAYLVWAIQGILPSVYRFTSFLPFRSIQDFLTAGDYVYDYGAAAFYDYLQSYGRTSTRRSLLTKLIAGDVDSKSAPLSDEEICVEISNLVFAASDTTGNTLTYLFFELARNPSWQEQLRKELRDTEPVDGSVPQYQQIKSLPVLNSVIWEALRVHPAAPASLPRVVPPRGGRVAGMDLPQDTVVSAQAYTVQRLLPTFPEPDTYNPLRWMTTDGGTDEMKELMLAFGKGTRNCLGQTMALMEMKLTTAALIKRFSVRLASPRTVDDMEMTDHFTLIPRGKKCLLVFERVEEKGV
ncbi:hypothetical protein W97_04989 [Coniosporium apollinis CBS 100218]|uniref:Cytochrome P450 n=1 Tax=Coniosporium apollinis (strain CBS 100218) TaxID=1168221 RepID=R7YUZ4_CONA1|nr:uncharacterized protein W97_04989 [Coniosporium apollinis CBS 100218]EON65750.1 hypothetical protein W97_04989 [Coniosporium apollinis CBS 100218]